MGEVKEIERTTARQFLNELEPSHDRWAKNSWRHLWIFRGQSDKNWRLIPSALRTKQEHASEQIVIARELGSNKPSIVDAKGFLQDAYKSVAKYDLVRVSQLLVQLYAEIRNLREFIELADSLNLNSFLPPLSEFHVFGTPFAKEYIANLNNSDFMFKLWSFPPIAIAQHHGVATRLLDWTKNPLYAAFFACENVTQTSTHIAV